MPTGQIVLYETQEMIAGHGDLQARAAQCIVMPFGVGRLGLQHGSGQGRQVACVLSENEYAGLKGALVAYACSGEERRCAPRW
jgi:hypothetical protein